MDERSGTLACEMETERAAGSGSGPEGKSEIAVFLVSVQDHGPTRGRLLAFPEHGFVMSSKGGAIRAGNPPGNPSLGRSARKRRVP
jgi:hypothetical protein